MAVAPYGTRITGSQVSNWAPVPNWLLRRPCKEISSGAKLVYARLVQYVGYTGRECYPAQDTLAEELGISLSQLKSHLDTLVKHKLIWKEQRGFGLPNKYGPISHEWMDCEENPSKSPESQSTGYPESHSTGDPVSQSTVHQESQSTGYPNKEKISLLRDHPEDTKDTSANADGGGGTFALDGDAADPKKEHSKFTRLWHEAYQAEWGMAYEFDGKRDGSALKRVLAIHPNADDLIRIAKEAWTASRKQFASKLFKENAGTIQGFCTRFREIQHALAVEQTKDATAAPKASVSVFSLQKERERTETQLLGLQQEMREFSWENTPEKRERLKALKDKVADLEAKIAKAL